MFWGTSQLHTWTTRKGRSAFCAVISFWRSECDRKHHFLFKDLDCVAHRLYTLVLFPAVMSRAHPFYSSHACFVFYILFCLEATFYLFAQGLAKFKKLCYYHVTAVSCEQKHQTTRILPHLFLHLSHLLTDAAFSSDASVNKWNYFSDCAHPSYSAIVLDWIPSDFVAGVVGA